eukprot:gene9793-2118_t
MYTELINKIKEENLERIHNAFEEVCLLGNKDDIIEFVKSFDIDINYDDGYPMENIACRNDLELFKVTVELGGDVNLNNSSSLRIFASKGNLEAVKYIIEELGCDHKPICWLPDEKRFLIKEEEGGYDTSDSQDIYGEDDEYYGDGNEFQRILDENYEENKEFYKELARKYPVE